MKIFYNKCLLWCICYLVSKINWKIADDNALWDDAQNYMEKRGNQPIISLMYFERIFDILHHRANERLEDVETEINHGFLFYEKDKSHAWAKRSEKELG